MAGRALLARAARWPAYPSWRGLTAEALREVGERAGRDFAAALLYDRLVRSPDHGPFIRRVGDLLESGRPCRPGFSIAVVPGAGYVEYPRTGAGGARLVEAAARWGCRAERIPVASFGSLADNARMIADWLTTRPAGPVVLVSLSKGSADVRTALARPDAAAAFRGVRAWVSLSGIATGTALAGWFLGHPLRRLVARLLCWRFGCRFDVLRELDRASGGQLAGAFTLPAGLRAVHVVGFPLARHLTRRGRRGDRRVARLGPSDGGGVLLGDVTRLPGLVYPVWGADHYLEPDWDVRPLIGRIVEAAGADESAPVLAAHAAGRA
jgi:hypothetical protein